MKIGIEYNTLEDCSTLLWCLSLEKLEKNGDGGFTFYKDGDEFVFVRNYKFTASDKIKNCDKKIKLFHNFNDWKQYIGYDLLLQSNVVENFHVENKFIKEFLDSGNIILSSASISFEHPNFYYEPLINLNLFYYFYGFNYLNYHKNSINKKSLLGTYHKLPGKKFRDEIFLKIKDILGNDFMAFQNPNFITLDIFESHQYLGLWGLNHINTYTDYGTTACNLVFETLQDNANEEDNKMFGRIYITEKTLKSLIFCEEEIFFMWYGPKKIYEYLMELGFWFYNSEFYEGDLKKSIFDASEELKSLKDKLKTDDVVYLYLKEKYISKLENNVKLIKKHLEVYYKKDNVINLIKNGNGN